MPYAVRRLALAAACLTPLILTSAGRAVILYATPDRNGAPAPGSIAEVPWSLQGQWGNFLGTPIAPNYFLTAAHVGGDPGSLFNFRGINYSIDASYGTAGGFQIANSDLRIWKVNETFPAFAPLYGTSATASESNKHIVILGRGTQRGAEVRVNGLLKGWEWGEADLAQSWGENTATGIASGSSSQGEFVTFDFDADVAGEGTLSGFDSGGGLFIQQGGEWQLAGINFGVDGTYSRSGDGADPFQAAIFDKSGLFEQGGNGSWQAAAGPAVAYSSRIGSNTRISAIYNAIPGFAIRQAVFNVPANTTADVGTVDASTSVSVGGATTPATLKASYIRGGTLTINRASHVLIKPNGSDANVSRVTKLTFNGTAIGQLDLTDNDMIIQPATNPGQELSFVILRIQMGRNGTATRWGGNGITSSTAAADPNQLMGLGAILNDNGHGGPIYTTFDGVPVDMNSILIKYTLMGDLNLNGKIDPDDFFQMDKGFANGFNSLNPYLNGDIDYNGAVNADDYSYIDRAFAMQVIAAADTPSVTIGSAVPEPGTVGLLTILLPLLARRRRVA